MVGQMGYHHDVSWASVEWTRLLKIIKKLGQNNEDQSLLKDSWESPCRHSASFPFRYRCKWILFHRQMWRVFWVSFVWLWFPMTSPLKWCRISYCCFWKICVFVSILLNIYHVASCSSARIGIRREIRSLYIMFVNKWWEIYCHALYN